MAIPRRTQAESPARSADRPLFLTDLPHVGEKSSSDPAARSWIAATANSSAQPAVSTHPAFAEIVSLDRARPSYAASDSDKNHFLDKASLNDNDQVNHENDANLNRPMRQREHSRTPQRGWRGLFSLVHTQLAPLAGLIVTLALLTSAGLLFWLISRGEPTSIGQQNFEFNEGLLSAQLSESEPAASALPISESPKAIEKVQEPIGALQAEAPVQQPADPIVEKPLQADVTASTPLGELRFPTTSTPLALDWSKAFDIVPSEPSSEIHGLPEVAEREDTSAENPVAR